MATLAIDLRNVADAGQWDRLGELLARHTILADTVAGDVPPGVLSQLGTPLVRQLLETTAAANEEALASVQVWRDSLTPLIRQLEDTQSNVSRLQKAYR
ncbi:flagellar protein FliT [Chitinimonas sp.]|uniref:flagellar protein FliT n=1 Tax=Chitinimonas sp. TaxID=1934313 RepID=UPI0035B428DD